MEEEVSLDTDEGWDWVTFDKFFLRSSNINYCE